MGKSLDKKINIGCQIKLVWDSMINLYMRHFVTTGFKEEKSTTLGSQWDGLIEPITLMVIWGCCAGNVKCALLYESIQKALLVLS